MTNLDSIFKSRDITLLTKVRLVKAMVFPVVMYSNSNGLLVLSRAHIFYPFIFRYFRTLFHAFFSLLKSRIPLYLLLSINGFASYFTAKKFCNLLLSHLHPC